jgi:hypothetical protein
VYDANSSDDSSSLLEEETAFVDAQYGPNVIDSNSDSRQSICLRNRCNIRILDEVERLWNSQELGPIRPLNVANHLHVINIIHPKKSNNILNLIIILISKLHAFHERYDIINRNGHVKRNASLRIQHDNNVTIITGCKLCVFDFQKKAQ